MGDVRKKYEVPGGEPSVPDPSPEFPKSIPQQEPSGLTAGGFGVAVVGYQHKARADGEGVIEIPRNTIYKLRFSNANDHLAIVKIEVDGVHIGSLLLNAYSFCDLERPLDRPFRFTFCPEDPLPVTTDNGKGAGKTSASKPEEPKQRTKKPVSYDRTCVLCTFQPEAGSRTLQFDVRAHRIDRCQRMEMPNECTANEMFRELEGEFGDWVSSPRCALIHWTTPEYDSPVEEVITSDMQMTLRLHPSFYRNSVRKEEPLRKMSLILMEKLQVIDGQGNEIVVDMEKIPRFGDIIENVQNDFAVGGKEENDKAPLYFLSDVKRYMGSTKWIRKPAYLFELLHKDEILRSLPSVKIFVTTAKPKDHLALYVRVLSGRMYQLEASSDTTISELRCQLAALDGPWGEAPRWLYGGTLLENGSTLGFYGIRAKDTVDVVLRMSRVGVRPLERREPIAVEEPNPINSAELLQKRPEPTTKRNTADGHQLRRGGTKLSGRTTQQFIEVDPIDVDDRFFTKLLLALVPDDEDILNFGDFESEKGEENCNMM